MSRVPAAPSADRLERVERRLTITQHAGGLRLDDALALECVAHVEETRRWISTGRVQVGGVLVESPSRAVVAGAAIQVAPASGAARRIDVSARDGGLRLDEIVARLFDVSADESRGWIDAGRVFVEGLRQRTPAQAIKSGERLVVHPGGGPDVGGPLDILFEDDDLWVINKAPGDHVNPTETSARLSIVERLDTRRTPAHLVHRLDRGTSGVLLVAKRPDAAARWARHFAERSVKKTYLALVDGTPVEETIDAPIGKDSRRPRFRRVTRGGKPAQTRLTPAGQLDGVGAVWAEPWTGRTHQIRVHLAHCATPILGDRGYGGPTAVRVGGEVVELLRPQLHARALEGAGQRFEAPWPADVERMIGRGLVLDGRFS